MYSKSQRLLNKISKVVFLPVRAAHSGSRRVKAGGEKKWKVRLKKKVFNSLKSLLIVPREQQIGPGYKTVIDLWKVEATARSQVPVLNCTPALSFHEAVIIKKKWSSFYSKKKKKITRWRRIGHKRLDFTAAALYDKFPGSAWIGCRFARRWKGPVACFGSFAFHI